MQTLSILSLGFLSSLFGVSDPISIDNGHIITEDEYTCEPHVWNQAPKIIDSHLEATISAQCKFLGKGGGGHVQLEEALRTRITNEALEIHSGPTEEVYKELPSTFYDATFKFESSKGDEADVRQDIHVASDKEKATVFDSFSTDIKATGNFKYLKKLDVLSTVLNTEEKGWYMIQLESNFRLKKPAFVPKELFINQVTKMIEAEIPRTEQRLISEMAPNI